MGSTNKTEYLGLSGWVHSDTPKMIDFATDNEIVDSILGEHINDSKIHLSEEDRALLGGSITSTLMAGNGSTSRTVTLSSAPKMYGGKQRFRASKRHVHRRRFPYRQKSCAYKQLCSVKRDYVQSQRGVWSVCYNML